MLKSLFCDDISVEYDFSQFSLYLSGNTTEFKTLSTRPRSRRYILFYIFTMDFVKICRFKRHYATTPRPTGRRSNKNACVILQPYLS